MSVTSSDSGYGEDFIQDADLEPFYDIFREQRSDWNSVKSGWGFTTIDYDDLTNQVVTDCGKKVGEQISAGKLIFGLLGPVSLLPRKRMALESMRMILMGYQSKGALIILMKLFPLLEKLQYYLWFKMVFLLYMVQ